MPIGGLIYNDFAGSYTCKCVYSRMTIKLLKILCKIVYHTGRVVIRLLFTY